MYPWFSVPVCEGRQDYPCVFFGYCWLEFCCGQGCLHLSAWHFIWSATRQFLMWTGQEMIIFFCETVCFCQFFLEILVGRARQGPGLCRSIKEYAPLKRLAVSSPSGGSRQNVSPRGRIIGSIKSGRMFVMVVWYSFCNKDFLMTFLECDASASAQVFDCCNGLYNPKKQDMELLLCETKQMTVVLWFACLWC